MLKELKNIGGLSKAFLKGLEEWDSKKLHPSDTSECPRAVLLRCRGTEETDPQQEDYSSSLTIGTAFHRLIQANLLHAGVVQPTDTEVSMSVPELSMTGSADVVILGAELQKLLGDEPLPDTPDKYYLLEFKTKGDKMQDGKSTFDAYTSPRYIPQGYIGQIQAYLEYLDLEWCLLFYVSIPWVEDNTYQLKTRAYWVKRDPVVGKAARDQLEELHQHLQEGSLPPRMYNKDSRDCAGFRSRRTGKIVFRCPYWKHCWSLDE
jgi:hypothetical protein